MSRLPQTPSQLLEAGFRAFKRAETEIENWWNANMEWVEKKHDYERMYETIYQSHRDLGRSVRDSDSLAKVAAQEKEKLMLESEGKKRVADMGYKLFMQAMNLAMSANRTMSEEHKLTSYKPKEFGE